MSIRTYMYNGYKYLNFPKEGGSSTKIGDIGDVANITDNSQHTISSDIHNTTVGGVSRLFRYKCCIKCRSKDRPIDVETSSLVINNFAQFYPQL